MYQLVVEDLNNLVTMGETSSMYISRMVMDFNW